MFRFGILLLLGLMTSLALAQEGEDRDSGEIYALAAVVGSPEIPHQQGFAIGGAWRPLHRFELVADFGKHFGADGDSVHLLMFGPRFYSEEYYRLSGFVQVLNGAGQDRGWGYVLAPGVGVDIRLTHKLILRPLQIDWLFPGPLRVSSGTAVRFGRWT
jgi:hypothetical protein